VAGIVAGAARETEWVHEVLYPFQVLFLAVFFVSVGMMLDLPFIWDRLPLIATLLAAVLLTNTAINAVIFRVLGCTWQSSLYGGALLSQIGEFSFVLAAVGVQVGLIERFSYQVTVAVIALSLLVSPAWVGAARRLRTAAHSHDPTPRKEP
jgi:CPA2 family monovalent cation:H+ antiporter-2